MNFKRKLIALLSVMCVIFTTGCEKAPEEVIKENEILNNAEIPSDRDNLIEYATMDEIRASVDEVIKNNTTNIQVDKIHISEGKTMPSYTVKLKKAFEEQDLVEIDNLMTYLYGEYDNTIVFDNASGFYEDYDITSEQYWFGKDDSGREMDILNYHPANIDVMQGGILLWSCGWSYVVDSTVFSKETSSLIKEAVSCSIFKYENILSLNCFIVIGKYKDSYQLVISDSKI